MANSRYLAVSEDDISNLLQTKDSESTKRVMEKSRKIFENFLRENGFATSFLHFSRAELNEKLRLFYASIRKTPADDGQPGELYKKNAFQSIKYGLAKLIKDNAGMDINNEEEFHTSQEVYKAVLKNLKQKGMGGTSHYPPICDEDIQKLYSDSCSVFRTDTPVGLQCKVWFELMFYFCRRGRENVREMTKKTFQVGKDALGKRYVFQAVDEADKNHSGKERPTDTTGEGRMYELEGDPKCPVASFEKYISKLHPTCECLWQRPLDSFFEDDVWYCNRPVGKNTLAVMMKDISSRAKLSKPYTNHSVRATHITTLDNAGFEARHIMRTSGHKSENSIRSYSHALSESKKRKIFETLSKSAGLGTSTPSASATASAAQNSMPDSDTVMPFDFQMDILDAISDVDLLNEEARAMHNQQQTLTVTASTESTRAFNFCPTLNNCTVIFNFGPLPGN